MKKVLSGFMQVATGTLLGMFFGAGLITLFSPVYLIFSNGWDYWCENFRIFIQLGAVLGGYASLKDLEDQQCDNY